MTINNAEEYERAMDEISRLMGLDPARGSEECERLRTLAADVEAYEREHFPIGPLVNDIVQISPRHLTVPGCFGIVVSVSATRIVVEIPTPLEECPWTMPLEPGEFAIVGRSRWIRSELKWTEAPE